MTPSPLTADEIAALRAFEGALMFRYRALLNRALDELVERRMKDEKDGAGK